MTTSRRIPQRSSLAAQAADILREEIHSGVWSQCLPGEMELCERLQVSRVTLRAALAQLQRERLVKAGQGRRREIIKMRPRVRRKTASKQVIFLLTHPLSVTPQFVLFLIDDLRERLSRDGYQLETLTHAASYIARPERTLQALIARHQPAGWILCQSTPAMQQWFSARNLPCVISGSRPSVIELPAIDVDYHALCRHAASRFLAKGHRHLGLVNPQPVLAGDRESEHGFRDGVSHHPESRITFCHHDGTRDNVCAQLDRLLNVPDRPTALLVSRANHVLTVLGHLSRRGLKVPQDMALISRDDDPVLQHVVPTVARYTTDSALFARKLCRLVLEVVRSGVIRPRRQQLMPHFLPGETLG